MPVSAGSLHTETTRTLQVLVQSDCSSITHRLPRPPDTCSRTPLAWRSGCRCQDNLRTGTGCRAPSPCRRTSARTDRGTDPTSAVGNTRLRRREHPGSSPDESMSKPDSGQPSPPYPAACVTPSSQQPYSELLQLGMQPCLFGPSAIVSPSSQQPKSEYLQGIRGGHPSSSLPSADVTPSQQQPNSEFCAKKKKQQSRILCPVK